MATVGPENRIFQKSDCVLEHPSLAVLSWVCLTSPHPQSRIGLLWECCTGTVISLAHLQSVFSAGFVLRRASER